MICSMVAKLNADEEDSTRWSWNRFCLFKEVSWANSRST